MMQCGVGQGSFLIIKPQIALHYAVQLFHFTGGFGAVFVVW